MPGETIGEAILEIKTDMKAALEELESLKGKTENTTQSFFKAQLAVDAFKKVVEVAKDIIVDSVAAYVDHEKAVTQLNTVLKSTGYAAGLTSAEITGMAGNLAGLTTFEDDAILSGQNLLLTFTNIGKDVFPQATETMLNMSAALGQDLKSSAIQLGKALQDPVQGVTALRKVGVNFNDEARETIKRLVETGRAAEAQAMILKELQVEFGGSARAMRDTFGGALTTLNNSFGELQETVGSYIAIVGKPFVEQMIEMTDGVTAFLNSEEGMKTVMVTVANLGASLSVAADMGKKVFDIFSKFVGGIFTDLENSFKKIFDKVDTGNVTFTILGGIIQNLSIGFSITGKIVHMFIETITGLVEIVKNSVSVLAKFGAALVDPFNQAKWDEASAAVKSTISAFVDLGKDSFNNMQDVVGTTIDAFKEWGPAATKTGEELKKTYEDSYKGIEKAFKESSNSIQTISAEQRQAIEANQKATLESELLNLQRVAEISIKQGEDRIEIQKWVEEETLRLKEKYRAVDLEAEKKALKEKEQIQKEFAKIVYAMEEETTQGKLDHLKAQYDSFSQAGVDRVQLEKWYAEEIKKVNDEVQAGYTKTAEALVGSMTSALSYIEPVFEAIGQSLFNQGNLWSGVGKAAVTAIAAIVKAIGDQLAAMAAADMVKAIAALASVVGAAAAPGYFAAAGIEAAGAAAAYVASGALRAWGDSFAEGGDANPGIALVGEEGPELVNFTRPAHVYTADETKKMLSSQGGDFNFNVYGDIKNDVDAELLSQKMYLRYKQIRRRS